MLQHDVGELDSWRVEERDHHSRSEVEPTIQNLTQIHPYLIQCHQYLKISGSNFRTNSPQFDPNYP